MSSSALTATLLVLAGVSICLSQTVDYCSPELCPSDTVNTLCKYKVIGCHLIYVMPTEG